MRRGEKVLTLFTVRDGFMRGVAARIDADPDDMIAFKEFFPNPRMKFPKGAVMSLFSHPGLRQSLSLDIDGHDYGSFEGRGDVIRAVIATYCSGIVTLSKYYG